MSDRSALLYSLAVGFMLRKTGARLMLAESCTGGLVSSWLTEIAGSSHWLDGAVVSYSNAIKVITLGVQPSTLQAVGAVSEATAGEMAAGLLALHGQALVKATAAGVEHHLSGGPQVAISITGVAGPTGGTPEKPVGTVCFGWAGPWGVDTHTRFFPYKSMVRDEIRRQAALWSLSGLLARLCRG